MKGFRRELEQLRESGFLSDLLLASTPVTLKRILKEKEFVEKAASDQKVLAAITEEIEEKASELPDLVLATFIHILDVGRALPRPELADEILCSFIERGLIFATSFLVHALRNELKLSLNRREMAYRRSEAKETLKALRKNIGRRTKKALPLSGPFLCPGGTVQVTGLSTLQGRPLDHICLNVDEVEHDPDPRTCHYTHFNLIEEELGKTWRYNCHGFTFFPRRFLVWGDLDIILEDNFEPVDFYNVRPGDVVRYFDNEGITHHTGRVWRCASGNGDTAIIRSKWGAESERIHQVSDIPSSWGPHYEYYRQIGPFRGCGDLWISDSWLDHGNQYSLNSGYDSPDILIERSPYNGSHEQDLDPSTTNRIFARVRNRSDKTVSGVRVRYYWMDPGVSMDPENWYLIPGTDQCPNPTAPFALEGYTDHDAPFVEWRSPVSLEAVRLLAVAYCGDDPKNSSNPDPLVYPFQVTWENNIAQRTVLQRRCNVSLISDYIVIEPLIQHLGDQPTSIGGGNFVGDLYYATFNLPENTEVYENAVLQCRTRHNEKGNKRCYINSRLLTNILEPHPDNPDEWMMDIAVVPKGYLKVGQNHINIGYTTSNYDDFLVDNIVLWYKVVHFEKDSKLRNFVNKVFDPLIRWLTKNFRWR